LGMCGAGSHDNTAIGQNAGCRLTGGICNIFIGRQAGATATTSCLMTAIGESAMGTGVATGKFGVLIGPGAGMKMTSSLATIGIGQSAQAQLTSGAYNIGIGRGSQSGVDGTFVTGQGSVAVGDSSMNKLSTGRCNAALGWNAMGCVTTGCSNIAIGQNAGNTLTTQSCSINIGCCADQTAAGIACIVASCLLTACFYETSDCRSKCSIKDLPYGLSFINLLRPVTYKWKPQKDKLDKDGNLLEEGEKNHTGPRSSFGLLGQEVKGALEKLGLGYNDFGAYSDQEYENRNNPDFKKSYTMENKTVHLSYVGFIAPLIKAVQELSDEVTKLKSKLKTA